MVAIVGYFTFTREPNIDQTITVMGDQGSAVGQELVIELNRLKALRNVSPALLSTPVFTSLLDFTQPVPMQPLGRLDPFAPVGSGL